jgi:DNA-directed RNA polymerase subunit M/transcription elongation factor TFIIS
VLCARSADDFGNPSQRARDLAAPLKPSAPADECRDTHKENQAQMAKIAKTGDRKKVMDTTKSTDCPKCGKPTRIVKRVKDRERGVPGGVYISCSACEFYEKL